MTFKVSATLTADICAENRVRILRMLGVTSVVPSAVTSFPADCVPSTHTFRLSSARSIFLDGDGPGLVCVALRNPDDLHIRHEKWKEVIEVGLEVYVFSYLGIHQAYYSKVLTNEATSQVLFSRQPIGEPVGLFLERATEQTLDPKTTNASFRDLAVQRHRFTEVPADHWFLWPHDAREICAREVASIFANDFWDYWGNPDSPVFWEREQSQDMQHWNHYYEMHFHQKVSPERFGALLWPVKMALRESDGVAVRETLLPNNIVREIKERWPSLIVLEYDYDSDDSDDQSFLRASFDVARYYAKHNKFPENLGIAQVHR